MTDREQRVAHNESTSRDINEHIEDAHDGDPPSHHLRIVCECGHATCERVVAITPEEYTELRGHSRRFAVVREHVIPDVEQIVEDNDRFVVVSKRVGDAADIAIDEDSRR